MLSAIAGDVIGSLLEGSCWKGRSYDQAQCVSYSERWVEGGRTGVYAKDFELFEPNSRPTDDSVLTFAVMDWLLNGGELSAKLRTWFSLYPDAGFGRLFVPWARRNDVSHPGSFGNGGAMRVSPVAFVENSIESVLTLAELTAVVTHIAGAPIDGAKAVAVGVFLARNGASKAFIKHTIETRFGYNLDTSLDEVRDGYKFSSECPQTVPFAFRAFLEADDYEGTIRRAVSIGGDADTIACMAGAVAGAFWGIPIEIRERTLSYLDDRMKAMLFKFEKRYPEAAKIAVA